MKNVAPNRILTVGDLSDDFFEKNIQNDRPIELKNISTGSSNSNLNGYGFVKSTGGFVTYVTGSSSQFIKANGTLDSNTYLTSINSSQITSALGFVPYDSSNPNGFIGTSVLSNYLTLTSASSLYQPIGNYLTTISSSQIITALGFTPYNATNPNNYITISSLSPYLTITSASSLYQPIGNYLTSISSSQIVTALGYTPYNSTNPNGYITSSSLTPYAPIFNPIFSGSITVNGYSQFNGSLILDNAQYQYWKDRDGASQKMLGMNWDGTFDVGDMNGYLGYGHNRYFTSGNHSFYTKSVERFRINHLGISVLGVSGSGSIGFPTQVIDPIAPANGFKLYANSTNALSWVGSNGFSKAFNGSQTASRTYTLQDNSGTIALLSDISAKQDVLNGGTGFVKSTAGTISYDNSTYLTGITSNLISGALGYIPYSVTNPSGYITSGSLIPYAPIFNPTFSGSVNIPYTLNGNIINGNTGQFDILGATTFSLSDYFQYNHTSVVNGRFLRTDGTGNSSWSDIAFSYLTSTPTTLSGYGITDAYPLTGNPTGFITSSSLTPYAPINSPIFTGSVVVNGTTTLNGTLNINNSSIYDNTQYLYWRDNNGVNQKMLGFDFNGFFDVGDMNGYLGYGHNRYFTSGNHSFYTKSVERFRINNVGISVLGVSGSGSIGFPLQTVTPVSPTNGFKLYANSTNALSWVGSDGFSKSINGSITANRTYTLQDNSGTIPLLETSNTWTGVNSFSGSTNLIGQINILQLGTIFNNSSVLNFQAGSSATGGLKLGTSASTPIKLYTNGIDRITIDSAGNLTSTGSITTSTGINVTGNGGFFNSANKFGLDFYNGYSRFYSSGTNGNTRGGYEFHTVSSDGLIDNTPLFVSNNSSIGINTTNPQYTLDVNGNINSNASILATNSYQLNGNYLAYISLGSNGINGRVIANITGTDGMYIGYGNLSNGITRIFDGGVTNTLTLSSGQFATTGFTKHFFGTQSDTGEFAQFSGAVRMKSSLTLDGVLRLNENIVMANGRFIYFKDSVGTDRKSLGVVDVNYYFGDVDNDIAGSVVGYYANDYHTFSTNGSEKMKISQNGNVGIGVTTPFSKLHIGNTTNINTYVTIGNPLGGLIMGHGADNESIMGGYVATNLRFGYNASSTFVETVRFNANGNVGIGINPPTSTLHNAGSEARVITTISSATTLGSHYYIIASGASTYLVTLPTASTCVGRTYVIKTLTANKTISVFLNQSGTSTTTLTTNTVITIVSDGTNWQQF